MSVPSYRQKRDLNLPDGDSRPAPEGSHTVIGVRLSHPSRVLFKDRGLTKRDRARYYDSAAEHLLPHAIDRPLTVVRCPRGESGKCFFQKHFHASLPDAIDRIDVGQGRALEVYGMSVAARTLLDARGPARRPTRLCRRGRGNERAGRVG